MYPKRLLVIAGLLAFASGLATLAPLSVVLKIAPDSLARRVANPAGTLWQGTAQLTTQQGPVRVSWDSHPGWLLLLTLSADWKAVTTGLNAAGRFELAPWGYRLRVDRGDIDGERLSRVMPGTRARLDQPLLLNGLDIQLSPGGKVERAAGRMALEAGQIRVGGRPEPLSVPALRGQLRKTDTGLQIFVDGEAEPGALLASIDLNLPLPGEMHLKVTDRAMRLAGAMPEGVARPPDTVTFEMRQPVR